MISILDPTKKKDKQTYSGEFIKKSMSGPVLSSFILAYKQNIMFAEPLNVGLDHISGRCTLWEMIHSGFNST